MRTPEELKAVFAERAALDTRHWKIVATFIYGSVLAGIVLFFGISVNALGAFIIAVIFMRFTGAGIVLVLLPTLGLVWLLRKLGIFRALPEAPSYREQMAASLPPQPAPRPRQKPPEQLTLWKR